MAGGRPIPQSPQLRLSPDRSACRVLSPAAISCSVDSLLASLSWQPPTSAETTSLPLLRARLSAPASPDLTAGRLSEAYHLSPATCALAPRTHDNSRVQRNVRCVS